MAITPTPDSAPAAVLDAVRGTVLELAERLPAAWTDAELVDAMSAAQRLRAALDGVEVAVLAEVDAREIPKRRLQWASTADWFTHLSGGFLRDGRRRVRLARALTSGYLATFAAVREGRASLGQAAVIVDAVEALPTSPALRAEAERALLDQTRHLTATELARAGRHVQAVVDPDGAERRLEASLDREERAAHRQRVLSITADGAGGIRLRGYGSTEDGETIRAALLPLTRPSPGVDPDEPDTRVLTDPRDHGARLWDALVQTAQHALDTEHPPESHGARPRVVVTTSLDTLTGDSSQESPTESGLSLSRAAVRRLACHADLIPGVLGFDGRVLDVGRTQRLVTAAIWTALVLRDQHCAFPGCTRPPVMCHAHHITHWADGGPTSLANLVLLCGAHHRALHHTPWQVRLNPDDQRPEFLPPPRDDGHRPAWMRHRPRRE